MNRLISLLLLLCLCVGASAQDLKEFQSYASRIDSLIANRAFQSAREDMVKLADLITSKKLQDLDSVRLYYSSTLAYIGSRLGDCEVSIQEGKNDLSIREELYGEGDLTTIQSQLNLGIYYLNCDSTREALAALNGAQLKHKNNFLKADGLLLNIQENLAFTYGKLGDFARADDYYNQVLDVIENQQRGAFYYRVIDNYSALLLNQERYQEASLFYEDLKDFMVGKPDYVLFLKDFHNAFVLQKNYVKALETAMAIDQICQENPDNCESHEIDASEMGLNAGRLSMLLAQNEQALSFYQSAENNYSDQLDSQIKILLEFAEVLHSLNRNNEELQKLQKAYRLHVSNNLRDSTSYGQTMVRLGALLSEMGKFDEANKLFQDELSFLESNQNTDPLTLARAYQSIGNQRYLLQNFKDADLYFSKASKLLTERGQTQSAEYASLLNSLGALNEALSNYDQAERNYRQGLNILKNVEAKALEIALVSNLANILMRTYPESDSIGLLLNQAIDWQRDRVGSQHPSFANLLGNRGLYYQNRERYDEAEKDYTEALEILEYTVGTEHPQYLTTLSNLGLLYDRLDKNDEGLDRMLKAKEFYEKNYSSENPGYILLLNNLANLYTKLGRYNEAEPLLLKLAEVQIKQIQNSFSYLSEQEKKLFVQDKRKFLDSFKRYVITRFSQEPGSVSSEVIKSWYNLELNTKGMLLNSTQKVRSRIFESGDEELVRLFSEWTLTRKQVAEIESLNNNQEISTSELDKLQSRIDNLEKELSRRSFEFTNSFSGGGASFEEVRQALGPTDLVIEIVRTDLITEALYSAILVTSSNPAPELILLGKAADLEKKGYSLYKNSIRFKLDDGGAFESFWQPIHDWIGTRTFENIYFSPDGAYHKINLATMYDAEEKDYLVEKYNMVQVTSTKDVIQIKAKERTTPANQSFLLIGRPSFKLGSLPPLDQTKSFRTRAMDMDQITDLPGTEIEVTEISEVLTKNSIQHKVFLRDQSTEDNFKEQLASHSVLHLATHGFFIDKSSVGESKYLDPMLYSGLLLAGVSNEKDRDKEDGILTAYEIMNMEFSNNEMVVLSACETGLGEVTSGEGIYGLQRAFLVAGSESIVMSLWKVDDEATKDLMSQFYKNYIKSGNKREAFLDAQKKIKKKYKAPFYWGAFVMIEG